MAQETKKGSKALFYGIIGVLIIALIVIITLFLYTSMTGKAINPFRDCEDVQMPYNETEYYFENESYPDKECTAVNMIFKSNLVKNQKDCIQEECATYNQVCSDYDQECATYTQQCASYNKECESYNQECIEKNFWGNCVKYESVCASYKDICASYKPVCSAYKDVCASYKSVCGAYKCVKYKYSCGLKVDNQEKQSLILNVGLYKQDYDTKTSTLVNTQNNWAVNPLDSKQLYWEFTALPAENVGCLYNFLNTPTMQVCRDVTKYKEVQKSRIVIKYKTETQCN